MHFSKYVSLCCLLIFSNTTLADNVSVKLTTSVGDILLELDADRAPDTVNNFVQYVRDDFYDGTIFHRVIEGFMIQGGGFTGDYKRKPTRAPVRNEANNGLRNQRYSISMARTNAPHSGTSQFFINSVDNQNLDHTSQTPRGWGYAVFGRVVGGHDIVDAISQVATGAGGPFGRDAPREQIVIIDAQILGEEAAGIANATDGEATTNAADPKLEETSALEAD